MLPSATTSGAPAVDGNLTTVDGDAKPPSRCCGIGEPTTVTCWFGTATLNVALRRLCLGVIVPFMAKAAATAGGTAAVGVTKEPDNKGPAGACTDSDPDIGVPSVAVMEPETISLTIGPAGVCAPKNVGIAGGCGVGEELLKVGHGGVCPPGLQKGGEGTETPSL